jgi:hypothetical protein
MKAFQPNIDTVFRFKIKINQVKGKDIPVPGRGGP